MSGKISLLRDPDLYLLSEALKDYTKLRHYIRRVQTRMSSMEEPLNSAVYGYADKELKKISGYVGAINEKISKYISSRRRVQ